MTQLQQVAFLCLLSPQRFHHFTLFLLFCFSDLGCLSSHPSSPPRLLSSCPPLLLLSTSFIFFPTFFHLNSSFLQSFFIPRFLLSFLLVSSSASSSFFTLPLSPFHLFTLFSFISNSPYSSCCFLPHFLFFQHSLSCLHPPSFHIFLHLSSFLSYLCFLSPFLPLPALLFLPLFFIFFPSFIPFPHPSSAASFPFCFFLCLSSFLLSSSLSSLFHLPSGFMSSHVSSTPSSSSQPFFLVASSLK